MRRALIASLVVSTVAALASGPSRAEVPADALAILDKGIQALGGEEVLAKAKGLSWKSKGTITFGGDDHEFSGTTLTEGLKHYRVDFEGEFNGNDFKGVTVLDGDKGWRKMGEFSTNLDGDLLTRERRSVYLQVVPMLLLPLKGEGFRVETAGEEAVGGHPAAKLKVTGPDGKPFTLFLDKESGLPVRAVATVPGFQGDEFEMVSTYSDFKSFDGIKKATRVESLRDGERFLASEFTEFHVLESVPAGSFTEPK